MEQIIKGFVNETSKGLDEICSIYSNSVSSIGKAEIEKVFFVMHSLTGSAAMFGFAEVSQYSVFVERLFDQIRKGIVIVNPQIMEYTVRISLVIKQIVHHQEIDSNSIELINFFKNQLGK